MILLYFFLNVIIYAIALAFYNTTISNFLLTLILPLLIAFLVITLPIYLIEANLMTTKHGEEVNTNFLYYFLDCLFLAFHLLRGLLIMPVRALLAILFLCLYFSRLDVYLYPGELKPMDLGAISFNSMVYMEHKYNNPITLVFREALRREIKQEKEFTPEQQAMKNLQSKLQQTILLHQNELIRRQSKSFIDNMQKEKEEFIQRIKDEIALKNPSEFKQFISTFKVFDKKINE